MTINNYVMSIGILNTLNKHSASMANHLRHISTGLRIANVADDPAGWAIGQRMDVRIRGLDQANRNAQQSKSLLKVADGGISSTVDILRTLKEKAIEAANDTATTTDRQTIQKLFDQYADQIDDNALVTYNGKYLLDGSRQGLSQKTQQAFTNEQLGKDMKLTTKLTDLTRRDGSSLNILAGDMVNVSYVKDGKTYSASYAAKDTTVEDIFKQMNAIAGDVFDIAGMSDTAEIGTGAAGQTVKTADGESAISVKAKDAGTAGSISGFTIGISDSQGQMKKTVNSALDAFTETIQAKDARADGSLKMQIGADANNTLNIPLGDMSSRALGLRGRDGSVLDVTTQKGANAAMDVLDKALKRALDQETTVGAMSSRLDYTISNLTVQSENLTDAKSTLLDADMAKEMLAYTRENVLMQAAMAMLAQNNKNAGWFLSLLG
ncbi:flagellin [Selenomonas bovis]|uniref:flagellin N-terminal helical domain-containing protein n=1 Tax=Selenomonas bovis TaxID=416586 RepID=UPI00036C341A|nr:flagellin [Selenomonas bovis]